MKVNTGLGRAALASTMSLLLFACSAIEGYPDYPGDPQAELDKLRTQYFDVAEVYKKHQGLESSAAKKAHRNEVISGRLRAVDIVFAEFERALYGSGVESNLLTDWAVIGVNGAGVIANGERIKDILHVVSGGIVGAKGAFDKHAYYDKTLPALLSQMNANRVSKLATIRAQMQKNVTEYPLDAGLSDVDDYFRVGSIPGAINAIGETSGVTTTVAKEALKSVRVPFLDTALDVVDGLSDDEAVAICNSPPEISVGFDSKAGVIDPRGLRKTSGDAARKCIKFVLTQSSRTAADIAAWKLALKTD